MNRWWQEIAKVAVRVLYARDRKGQSEPDSSAVPSKRLKRTPPPNKQLQEVLLASHTKDVEIAKLKAGLEDKRAADELQRELTDTQAANAALAKQLEMAGPDALAKLHGELADKEAENAALKRSLEEAGASQEVLDGLRQAVSDKGAEVASLSQQIEEARTKGGQLTKQLVSWIVSTFRRSKISWVLSAYLSSL